MDKTTFDNLKPGDIVQGKHLACPAIIVKRKGQNAYKAMPFPEDGNWSV